MTVPSLAPGSSDALGTLFDGYTIGAAFEAARYARRSRGAPVRTNTRPAAARMSSVQLFVPEAVPTREGLAFRITGQIALPSRR